MLRGLLLSLFLFISSLTAAEYDVFILAGQSNMDGRGKVSDLPEVQKQPLANVKFFYQNPGHSTENWIALAPGYSIAPGYKGDLPSPSFGPEIGFGHALNKALPTRHLALLKLSKGGTSLSKDWNPGEKDKPETQGPLYKAFLSGSQKAFSAMKTAGDTYVIRGMIWHQGESDAASKKEVYEKELTAFIGRVREDLAAPEMPFVIGEVYDNGKRDSVRAAQVAVSKSVAHCGYASAESLKTQDNGTHFDATSQLMLGERFAAELLKMLDLK